MFRQRVGARKGAIALYPPSSAPVLPLPLEELTRQRAIKRLLLRMGPHVRPQSIPARMRHSFARTVIPHTRVRSLSNTNMFLMDMFDEIIHVPQIDAAAVPAADTDLFGEVFIVRVDRAGGIGDAAAGVGGYVGRHVDVDLP
jgi:hypothetical protein